MFRWQGQTNQCADKEKKPSGFEDPIHCNSLQKGPSGTSLKSIVCESLTLYTKVVHSFEWLVAASGDLFFCN